MKVFIVFLGLLLLSTAALIYQGDINRYSAVLGNMKALSEECAAGAALYLEEEELGEGRIVFDYEAGTKYAEELVGHARKNSGLDQFEEVTIQLYFRDDNTGYEHLHERDCGSKSIGGDCKNPEILRTPGITAKIEVKGRDFFRLPYMSLDTAQRKSMYELTDIDP